MKTNKRKFIIWGAIGHAKVLYEMMGQLQYEVVAFFDNNREVTSPFKGVPIFYGESGFITWLSSVAFERGLVHCQVAIGGHHGKDRHQIQKFMEENGVLPVTVIHPRAFCPNSAELGKGTQVLANATVSVEVKIGEACIINSGSIVEHESQVGDGVHICPGSHIAGRVIIGNYSMIGTGSTILPDIKIGRNVIVGAGSVVTKDVGDNLVVCGNPARFLRINKTM